MPDLQSLFAKTSGLANKIKNALEVFDNEIEVAFIFGSVARGERRSESDVDVLVIGNVTAKDLAIPISKLEKELRIQLNFVKYSKEEFSEMIRNNNHFLQTVLDDQKIFLKGYADELAKLAGEP